MDQSYVTKLAERELQRHTRRVFLQRMGGTALAATGGSAILAACGSSSKPGITPSGGHVGGTLAFLGIDGEDGPAVAKPFLSQHRIKLSSSYAADNDTILTKLRTGGESQFSLLTIPKDSADREIMLGLVRPLDLSKLKMFNGVYPGLQKAPWITHKQAVYGVPLTWGSEPCVFNPTKFKSMPPKYTDFADPKYKRALTTIDEPYGNQWLVAKSLGFGQNGQPNLLTQAQLDKVRDAWIQIKKNVVAMTGTFGDQTDLLVRGEASIALNSWQALVSFAKAKGVTLAYASPADDGTYYWSDSYFITAQAPNPATAYAFIDYMTSPTSNAKMAVALQSGCTVAAAHGLLPGGSIAAGYQYNLVEHQLNPDFTKVIIPPPTPAGSIVGKQAWVKSWEQVKAS